MVQWTNRDTVETVGVFAVVISLIFVGMELAQNTSAIRAQTVQEIQQDIRDQLRFSKDEANSWTPFYHATKKEVGFAYSCMSETYVPKTLGLLYETEDPDSCKGPSCKILFTTFDLPN